jgi:hypothetical protein
MTRLVHMSCECDELSADRSILPARYPGPFAPGAGTEGIGPRGYGQTGSMKH